MAKFLISTLAVGTHSISADYSGATGFATSTSNTASFVVSPAVTTTTLTATPNTPSVGQQVTFAATVTPSPGNLGTVTFKDSGAVIAANVPVVGGVATFPISTLTVGTIRSAQTIAGATGFTASVSNAVNFIVFSNPNPLTVNTTSDILGHTGGMLSLRQAVLDANDAVSHPGPDVIQFAPGLSGTIALASEIPIAGDLTINGPGADKLTVSGGGTTRIFNISATTTVAISGLTIANGKATVPMMTDQGPDTLGGGILNNAGHLSVSDSAFTNNQVVGAGDAQAPAGRSRTSSAPA